MVGGYNKGQLECINVIRHSHLSKTVDESEVVEEGKAKCKETVYRVALRLQTGFNPHKKKKKKRRIDSPAYNADLGEGRPPVPRRGFILRVFLEVFAFELRYMSPRDSCANATLRACQQSPAKWNQ